LELKKNGRADATITTADKLLSRLAKHCNINSPKEVKEEVAKFKWKNSTREAFCFSRC